ncbi:MAG: hypothetical protein AAGE61_16410 [Pseudomonadota bacterium]
MKTALRTSITKDMGHIRPIALLSALHLGVTLFAVGIATDVKAGDVTKTGPNGGTVTKHYSQGHGGSVTRTGPNGAVSSGTVECGGTIIIACERRYYVTGPDGHAYSGERASVHTPYRTRSKTTVTGPEGNSATRYRAVRRPYRVYRY